jgi:hypothetical protein
MRRFWQQLGERITVGLGQRPGPVREIGGAMLVIAACLLWLDAITPPLALTARLGPRMIRTRAAMAEDPRLMTELEAYRPLVAAWVQRTAASGT